MLKHCVVKLIDSLIFFLLCEFNGLLSIYQVKHDSHEIKNIVGSGKHTQQQYTVRNNIFETYMSQKFKVGYFFKKNVA